MSERTFTLSQLETMLDRVSNVVSPFDITGLTACADGLMVWLAEDDHGDRNYQSIRLTYDELFHSDHDGIRHIARRRFDEARQDEERTKQAELRDTQKRERKAAKRRRASAKANRTKRELATLKRLAAKYHRLGIPGTP